jgi:hypothetical protein
MSPRSAARCWAVSLTLLAAGGFNRPARAEGCTDNSLSTCVDTNPLWLPAGDSEFASVDSSPAQKPGVLATALSTQYAHKPIVLTAPGPDPFGTEVDAVSHVLDVTLGASVGVLPRLEVGAALPVVLSQAGTGVSTGTSLQSESISSMALRDPRLMVGFDLFDAPGEELRLSGKLSYTLSLPLGDDSAFAGERGVVNAPQVGVIARWRRFTFGTALGLRLRAPVRLGDARVGSQLSTALGLAFDTLDQRRLTVALEAWALHGLVSQQHITASGTLVDSSQVPAEWLLSLRSSLLDELSAQAGFGTAIPWSSSTRVASNGEQFEDNFAAVPAAKFRVLVAVRYLLQ